MPAVLALFSLFSCTVVKKNRYPSRKPFVFSATIKVEGNMKSREKQDFAARLANQLDDSLRTPVVNQWGVVKKIIDPPVFDTANVRRSIGFMVALLNAEGYYTPVIKDTVLKDTVGDQYRFKIRFQVWPGKQLKLDSVGYDLHTPELQALALKARSQSVVKKGSPYSKTQIVAEVDRLVELFRNNGYYKFSREDLVVVRDTVVAALIDPALDPFQQAALLETLKKKRENPTIDIVIQQRPVKDSSHIVPYGISHVTIYPDLPILEDTVTTNYTDTGTAKKFTIISRGNKFKRSFLTKNVYLRPDDLYKQSNYNRTLNRFNEMGAWQQAAIALQPSDNADSMLDVYLRLYPSRKQAMDISLEASRNTNDIVTASNLFGVGLNLGLRNRNTFKQSVLSSTNLRGGVELGANFIQTTQASFSHRISFPKLIAPGVVKRVIPSLRKEYSLDSIRTILDFNASYTDRRDLFTLRSFSTSWGYQWIKGNRSYLWKPLNIEYTKLDGTDSLTKLMDSIPSLRLAFRSGLVVGLGAGQFVYSSVRKHGIHTDFLRLSAEESGTILGLIRSLDEGDLWRFVRGDIEYRHHIDYKRTQLAMRAYAGAGWAYGRQGQGMEQTLPFYKAYFAGGPNSMRAWQVRQLGLGSSKFYDTLSGGKIDRFGDVQLEGNIEYRFLLGTVFGVKLKSALYMDAGNIWNHQLIDSAKRDVGSDFKFSRFYKEFAVSAGTGLRLDFDYFLIRFDWAYRLRDPQNPVSNGKWLYNFNLSDGQFQLGIGYPF